MAKKDTTQFSPVILGFLQALGVTPYCSLVGVIFWKGNEIFGKVDRYVGPVMFLLLFIACHDLRPDGFLSAVPTVF